MPAAGRVAEVSGSAHAPARKRTLGPEVNEEASLRQPLVPV